VQGVRACDTVNDRGRHGAIAHEHVAGEGGRWISGHIALDAGQINI
jgi:hypothetical protein